MALTARSKEIFSGKRAATEGEGNWDKASGDDLFLLAKAARIYPQAIAFAQSPGRHR
jgi:hypothetical protein